MKARTEGNKIKIYKVLPSKFKSATLNVAGGFHLMPAITHLAQGFYNLVIPTYNSELEKLGEIYFDEVGEVFTYPVISIYSDMLAYKKAKAGIMYSILKAKLFEVNEIINEGSETNVSLPNGINAISNDLRQAIKTALKDIDDATTEAHVLTAYNVAILAVENVPQYNLIEIYFSSQAK